jgi:hypothetical protein
MTWRAAFSIDVLFEQLQRAAPKARPGGGGGVGAAEWGKIGDALHDPTSDHAPHDFPGWGNDIVTAGDFPNRPDLGLDAHAVLDDIRRSRDPRVKYGISNGQMFSSYATSGYPAWAWRPYNPKNGDKHFTHGHLSVVGNKAADGTQPWATIGAALVPNLEDEDDDMGASFGPIVLESGTTSLCIPPVQAGLADPRKVWLNVGGDLSSGKASLRVWGSNGDKAWFPVTGAGLDKDGKATLDNGQVLSVELPKGLRLLSVSTDSDRLSACFERQ